jgi:hypothetical protein
MLLEGPAAPREVWAAEHCSAHRTVVAVDIRSTRRVEAASEGKGGGGGFFVVYVLRCQGLLGVSWELARRFAEFAELREVRSQRR